MNFKPICDDILKQGFSVIPSAFSSEEIDQARVLPDKYNHNHNQTLRANSDRDMVHNCHELSSYFLSLFEHRLINDILSFLLDILT